MQLNANPVVVRQVAVLHQQSDRQSDDHSRVTVGFGMMFNPVQSAVLSCCGTDSKELVARFKEYMQDLKTESSD